MLDVSTYFSDFNTLALCVALAFILLDVISGVVKGFATSSLSSEIMRKGIWHKMALLVLLVTAALCDLALVSGLDISEGEYVFTVVCGYICLMELTSIFENVKEANPQLENSPVFALFGKETK